MNGLDKVIEHLNHAHFSETSKETMTDKIKRLILNDCAKEFEQSEKIS